MRVSRRSKSGFSRGNISFVGLDFLPDLTGLNQSGRVPTRQAENQLVVRMMPRLGVGGLRRQSWRQETVVTTVPSHPCEQAHGIRLAPAGKPERFSCSTANGSVAVRLIGANERRKEFSGGAPVRVDWVTAQLAGSTGVRGAKGKVRASLRDSNFAKSNIPSRPRNRKRTGTLPEVQNRT